MKAFQADGDGAAPSLREIDAPRPAAGEILVRIGACALNFADLLMISGEYQDTPEPPFTLGMEAAGTIEALGPDTDAPAPGTRVAVFGGHGGLAEFGCFPAARAVELPDGVALEDAAALQIAHGTSHVALERRARLQPGETLLVLGAAGGVGLAAVEIGKLMGARVIACATGEAKLAAARAAGADHLIAAQTDDIREACKALGGVDVVLDPVGGDPFRAALRACRPEARILVIGFASGEVPQIPANHLLVKNATVIGFYWGGYLRFREEVVTDSLAQLFAWHAEGRLRPRISHRFALAQAGEALETLRARKSAGKIVVTPR